jgi:Tol biopolymer transport system component/DNA-binding winged helix-turn-helix (wHTH) protein
LYEFGPFRLDAAERLLRREGEVVPISPKTFDLLLALVERRGRLVEKEELLRAVWPDTIVEEANLASNISLLRKALGENGNGNKFIETVPKRGYRFVADVTEQGGKSKETLPEEKTVEVAAAISEPVGERRRSRMPLWIALASLLIVALGAVAAQFFASGRNAGPAAPRHLWQLTFDAGLESEPTWSPDGSLIAYSSDRAGNFDIWVKPAGEGDPVQVTHSPAHDWQPDYSPDGKSLAFRSERDGGGIYIVPVLGGVERKVADFGYRPRWSPAGGRILIGSSVLKNNVGTPRLYLIDLDGKPPREVLSELQAQFIHALAAWHPDGLRISIWGIHRNEGWGLWTVSPDGGPAVKSPIAPELKQRGLLSISTYMDFRWAPSGKALYFEFITTDTRNLLRVDVEPQSLALLANPERLTTGVGMDADIAIAPNGKRLAFTSRKERTRLWAFPFAANQGAIEGPGTPITADELDANEPDITRDGKRLAFFKTSQHTARFEMWERSFETGGERLLLAAGGFIRAFPRWSRDGARLAYRRRRSTDRNRNQFEAALGMLRAGGREEELLTTPSPANVLAYDWSADGNWILGGSNKATPRMAIVMFPLRAAPCAETQMRPITSDPDRNLWQARFSPDERWISFNVSNPTEPGVSTIHVVSQNGGEWTQITDGKSFDDKARWSPDGRTIYFISNRAGLMNVWGIRFDPARGKPAGEPFRVTRFESPSQMILPLVGALELTFSHDRLILPMTSVSGNLWVLENIDR